MSVYKNITIGFPLELAQRLEKYSRETGRSKRSIILQSVENGLCKIIGSKKQQTELAIENDDEVDRLFCEKIRKNEAVNEE